MEMYSKTWSEQNLNEEASADNKISQNITYLQPQREGHLHHCFFLDHLSEDLSAECLQRRVAETSFVDDV